MVQVEAKASKQNASRPRNLISQAINSNYLPRPASAVDQPCNPSYRQATLGRTNPPLNKINMVNRRLSTTAAAQLRLRVCLLLL
jgi:hypothetical protein